jgi:ABC-type lipoprotein release transport system permease subunit
MNIRSGRSVPVLLVRLAWRNIWRQKRRTWITAGAMAFGVAFCMATIAWSDGMFQDIFRIVVRQNLGHVQIHAPLYPSQRALEDTIPHGEQVLAEVRGLPGLQEASGRLYGYSLLGVGEKAAGAQLEGVDPVEEARLTGISGKVTQGSWLSPKPSMEIVLGEGLAESLNAKVGDEATAVTQAADGSIGNDLYKVVGVFRTGSVAFDRGGAFLHIEDLRTLLALPGQLHEIVLVSERDDDAEALAVSAHRLLAGRHLLVRSWKEVNPQVAQVISLQDAFMEVVLLMVFSVAALGILNTMLMSVFERTRELGVVSALGLRPGQLVVLVLLETLFIALVAAAVGLTMGLAFDGALVKWGIDLRFLLSSETWSFGGASMEPVMHGIVRARGILATLGGLFAVSLLAALWPAVRAARVRPVVAMRQE